MKELEDYVNEKKQTNKYLDDISDIDAPIGSNLGQNQATYQKERMSKLIKDKSEIVVTQHNNSGIGLI